MKTVQSYRIKQIEKIIDSVFSQFNITDTTERYSIATDIANRLNIGVPLSSSYSRSEKASSSKYRADVRAFLVDTISELLYLKNLDTQLNDSELISRELIQNTSNKIDKLVKELRLTEDIIVETFEEGLVSGKLANLGVKDGYLRLDKTDSSVPIRNIKYEVIPAASYINKTTINTSGNVDSLINTGLGTDSFWINVEMPITPVIDYIDEEGDAIGPIEGIFVSLEVETDNLVPLAFAIKASTDVRINSIYNYNDDKWTKMKNSKGDIAEDTTSGTYSFVDNLGESTSSRYKILLHIPFAFSKTDKKVQYKVCLHNLKITESTINRRHIIGEYLSDKYSLKNKSLLKVKLDADSILDDNSFIEYEVIFTHGNSQTIIPILTKNTTEVITGLYADDNGVFNLPFPVEGETLDIFSETGIAVEEGALSSNDIDFTLENANSTTFLLFKYTSQEYTKWLEGRRVSATEYSTGFMKLDEAIFYPEVEHTDHHDKLDGRIFKLTKVPFVNVTNEDTKFEIYVNNTKIDFTDITPYSYPEDMITFSEGAEFYLKSNQLHFSFNLLDTTATQFNDLFSSIESIKVVYKIKADSVQLKAKLYGENPLLDLYKLELIGINNGI